MWYNVVNLVENWCFCQYQFNQNSNLYIVLIWRVLNSCSKYFMFMWLDILHTIFRFNAFAVDRILSPKGYFKSKNLALIWWRFYSNSGLHLAGVHHFLRSYCIDLWDLSKKKNNNLASSYFLKCSLFCVTINLWILTLNVFSLRAKICVCIIVLYIIWCKQIGIVIILFTRCDSCKF